MDPIDYKPGMVLHLKNPYRGTWVEAKKRSKSGYVGLHRMT